MVSPFEAEERRREMRTYLLRRKLFTPPGSLCEECGDHRSIDGFPCRLDGSGRCEVPGNSMTELMRENSCNSVLLNNPYP